MCPELFDKLRTAPFDKLRTALVEGPELHASTGSARIAGGRYSHLLRLKPM
jgi:hypothetical protein